MSPCCLACKANDLSRATAGSASLNVEGACAIV